MSTVSTDELPAHILMLSNLRALLFHRRLKGQSGVDRKDGKAIAGPLLDAIYKR